MGVDATLVAFGRHRDGLEDCYPCSLDLTEGTRVAVPVLSTGGSASVYGEIKSAFRVKCDNDKNIGTLSKRQVQWVNRSLKDSGYFGEYTLEVIDRLARLDFYFMLMMG